VITVTQEMEDAYVKAAYDGSQQVTASVVAGLEAVMALIDPVPDEVRKARIVRSDWEFMRIMSGEDGDIPADLYRGECGCHFYTHQQIVEAAALEESEVEWS
jgi:hypothetical protein